MCENRGDIDNLPSIDELLEGLEQDPQISDDIEKDWVKHFQNKSIASEEKYAKLKGLKDHYRHKSRWSNFLILLMAFMVGFQSFLLFKVGTGEWDFTDYSWLLTALLAQNLAQVVGLAIFVVKSLFSDPK